MSEYFNVFFYLLEFQNYYKYKIKIIRIFVHEKYSHITALKYSLIHSLKNIVALPYCKRFLLLPDSRQSQ